MNSHSLSLHWLLLVFSVSFSWAQTSSVSGTVKDTSGAVIARATVVVASPERGITREMSTNATGEYNQSGLPAGNYDIVVTATGFTKYQAKGVILDVAHKARVDVTLQVGNITDEVDVEGSTVATVETQDSELTGVVTGREITQLELNGRDFKQLITLVPGVSNQTGADEGGVGIVTHTGFSVNGGRTEYNDWEVDGGDAMDNGSNSTLNVTPSIDAIGEFKVLTSNYGAQYGRNGSGTVEIETKSGTKTFHGDAYEFVRNDAFNANNYFNSVYRGGTGKVPEYKKNDFGYTLGGPIYIPGVYNQRKEKTFFFWSEDWRRERVPVAFSQPVPYSAERTGNFNDLCPNPQSGSYVDCPVDPATGKYFANNQVPVAAAANVLLPLISLGTTDVAGASMFIYTAAQPTSWRQDLIRLEHNLSENNRLTFRYIHDSWNSVGQTTWAYASFPTVKQSFEGPGVSMVVRLTSTVSATLLNEFVASYTTDHITTRSQGYWQRPSNFSTLMGSFPSNNNFGGKLPAIIVDGGVAYGGGFAEDPAGAWPEGLYNSNPTYTYRDNLTKTVRYHNLQAGVYFVAAQKNELSILNTNGVLFFSKGARVSTGNAFADMLMGNIANYSQGSNQLKFYHRYKILEPYLQDDWRITDRLTLNLGLRVSLEGTYHERYKHAYNWNAAVYGANSATAPMIYDANGNAPANAPRNAVLVGGVPGALVTDSTTGQVIGDPFVGLVHCGFNGVPASCMQGHLFNPAPRIGFAFDPFGNGKTAIRGGYGFFFEHTNGNEANTEGMMEGGQSSPELTTESQINIIGYTNIGKPLPGSAPPSFPIRFIGIPTKAVWPYVQQWHLDVQRELPSHTVVTVSYVGSKGTHLARQRDLNQLHPTPASQNPYHAGQPITAGDCATLQNIGEPNVMGVTNGQTFTGQPAISLQTACGNDPNPYRPYYGVATVQLVENRASSIYHALQVAARKSVGTLNLTLAYTYSHSIDDSSDRFDSTFVNSYDLRQARASSVFDERHMLNVAWVYDLPLFKKSSLRHALLGGWQLSGVESFATGTPLSVVNGTAYGDNAGLGNGVGTGSFADRIGNPKENIPSANELSSTGYSEFALNPTAYALPTGLTFGNSGRDSLNNRRRLNFDMGILKHFAIQENKMFEFRFEAFNVFNHTEWAGFPYFMTCTGGANNSAGDRSCLGPGGANLFEINSAHLARVVQLGAKFIF